MLQLRASAGAGPKKPLVLDHRYIFSYSRSLSDPATVSQNQLEDVFSRLSALQEEIIQLMIWQLYPLPT